MEYVKQPKTKRGERTLKRIVDAAEELFAEHGYYATEIHDITEKAGVATGTLYLYFPNKLSLFLHLLDKLGRELKKEIKQEKKKAQVKSIVELERISIRVFFMYVHEHFGLFSIVWQSQFVDIEAFKLYFESFSQGYVSEIKKAQESGEVKDFLDPTLISFALMGVYNWIALKHILIDKQEPDDAVVDQLIELISYGMLRTNPTL